MAFAKNISKNPFMRLPRPLGGRFPYHIHYDCSKEIFAEKEKYMIFETERLRIRNLNENDIEKMICYRSDERCNKFQRYEDFSYEYMHNFIEKYEHSIFLSLEDEQHYAITLKNDSSIVGDFSVFYTESDNCFTLGITIAPEIQRQGIAYEVLESTVKRIIEKYPTMDIVALIEKENAGSIALFQKLGFIEECYADSIQSWVYCIYGRNE